MFEGIDLDDDEEEVAPSKRKEGFELRKPVCPYICSTPLEFTEERDFLAENIYPSIVEFAVRRGVLFCPTDLRWAPDNKVFCKGELLRLLLDSISKCSPFFICLLGERYGPHRPENEPPLLQGGTVQMDKLNPLDKNYLIAASATYSWLVQEDNQSCSLTELEIIHAAFLGDSTHCRFYFRQKEHLEGLYRNASDEERSRLDTLYQVESEYAGMKIQDLRQRIVKKGLPVQYYTTLGQLGNLVLNDWIDIVDMLYPPLVKQFDYLDSEAYREWVIQESFAESRRLVYVASPDNDAVMSRLTEFALRSVAEMTIEMPQPVYSKYRSSSILLNNRLANLVKYKSVLCVTGERGSGKSSIITQWLHELEYPSMSLKLIPCLVGCSSRSADITVYLKRCINELRTHFLKQNDLETEADHLEPCCEDELEPTTFHELCQMFLSAVSLGPCVLVLDGVDELGGSVNLSQEVVKEFGWLPAILPPHCKVILTTTGSDITHRHLARRHDTVFVAVPPVTSADRQREILAQHMGDHYARLTDRHLDQLQEMRVCTKPLFLSTLASQLTCHSVYVAIGDFLEELQEMSSVREFWMKSLKRWIKEYSWLPESDSSFHCEVHDLASEGYSGWIADALCLILLSRNGLTQSEIFQLLVSLGYRDGLEVTLFDWHQLRTALGPALHQKVDGLVCFSHHHIKEIVQFILLKSLKNGPEDYTLAQDIDNPRQVYKRKLHENLASFFARMPYCQRKLEELPWQLMMSGNCFNLLKVLENLDYFLDFVNSNGKYPSNKRDLLMYWKFLEEHGYRASEHYLDIFVGIGLIQTEQQLKSTSRVNSLAVIEEKPIEYEDENLVECHACYSEFPRKKICGSPYQSFEHILSSGMVDSQFFIAEGHKHYIFITADGKVNTLDGVDRVTSLAWHVSQLLAELGYRESTERILSALITMLNKNYPLSNKNLVMRARALEVIGNLCHAEGRAHKAETNYREALGIITDIMEEDDEMATHPVLRKLRSRMLGHQGSILLKEGELYEAQELLKEALEYTDDSFKNIPLTATILYNLSLLRLKQGDLHRVESSLRQSLALREQWFGKTHPLVADVLNQLARLLSSHEYKGRDPKQAEYLYHRTIHIREECLGNQHLLTAEVLFALGELIGDQTSLTAKNESIRLLKQALDITTSHLGLENTDTKHIQQALTAQEVMLRLGNYEFGHAKPLDMRSRRNPFSTLTMRDKDLKRMQKTYGVNKSMHEALSIRAVSRDEMLRHSQPASHVSSTNSHLSTSDGDRLLRNTSAERRLKHSANGESSNSPVQRSRLTVDMNFVADSTTGGTSDLHKELILDSFAVDSDAECQDRPMQRRTSAGKSYMGSTSGRDSFKMFTRYASSASSRSRVSNSVSGAAKSRGKYSPSPVTSASSAGRDGTTPRGHLSRCSVPGRQSLYLSNQQTVVGPHSDLRCLMDYRYPERTRQIHHQSAWYHVPGRYPTPEIVYPPKRSQTRPWSVTSGCSQTGKPRSVSSQSSRRGTKVSRGDAMSAQSGSEVDHWSRSEEDAGRREEHVMDNKHQLHNGLPSSSMVTFHETVSVG